MVGCITVGRIANRNELISDDDFSDCKSKMKPKVGIIGRGSVGSSIQSGLDKGGYATRIVGSDPKGVSETAKWADIVILAVPFAAIDDALKAMGNSINGKALIDASNIVGPDAQQKIPATSSGAKELQRKASSAKVVKAFNTIFAEQMATGHTKGQQISLFVAGDDKEAKAKTLELARDIGFDAIDAGPLDNARYLEAMGNMMIQLGMRLGMGREVAFKVIH